MSDPAFRFTISSDVLIAVCVVVAVVVICRTVTRLSRKDDRQTFWSEWDD